MLVEILEEKESGISTNKSNCAVSHMTLYEIHETTVCLMNLLEHYPEQSPSYRLSIAPIILGEANMLLDLLAHASGKLRDEWMCVAAALKCYVIAGWEEDWVRTWSELLIIRLTLGLDECFGNRPVREHKSQTRLLDKKVNDR